MATQSKNSEDPHTDDQRAAGADIGATLAKIALRDSAGGTKFDFLPSRQLSDLCERLDAFAPHTLGITGCGAAALAEAYGRPVERAIEFEAWGRGAQSLLRAQEEESANPFLLVSLGTGTSVLRVAGTETSRVGGTALGGGTIMGLGGALTDCENYVELCDLAVRGNRGRVDLLVGDIYSRDEISLPGDLTAASFGNIGRWQDRENSAENGATQPRQEDLAAAIMGLVGENVALICCGLGQAAGIGKIVYGGSTVTDNPSLLAVLLGVTTAAGMEAVVLGDGGFAGALGALELAAG